VPVRKERSAEDAGQAAVFLKGSAFFEAFILLPSATLSDTQSINYLPFQPYEKLNIHKIPEPFEVFSLPGKHCKKMLPVL
jgi:hypothetical protein